MAIQFRRRRSIGPFRLTASQGGLGLSVGLGPFRLSFGADGKTRWTWRVAGVYETKVIGTWRKR